jgi:hypothetical protein
MFVNYWEELQSNSQYQERLVSDKRSCFWDILIEHVSKFVLADEMEYGNTLSDNENVLRYLARENRFARRLLSEALKDFFVLAKAGEVRARMTLSPSGIGYVFFAPPPDYDRQLRVSELGNRCFIARNDLQGCITVVGIGINVERAEHGFAEDLFLLISTEWTEKQRQHAEQMKVELGLFKHIKSNIKRNDGYYEP